MAFDVSFRTYELPSGVAGELRNIQGVWMEVTNRLAFQGTTIEGMEEVARNFKLSEKRTRQVVMMALQKFISEVYTQSQYEVPVDTGKLKSTFYVAKNDWSSAYAPAYELGYDAEYAWAVHEWYEMYGRPIHHKPPTKQRFLADPFEAASARFSRDLQTHLKSAIDNLTAMLGPDLTTISLPTARTGGPGLGAGTMRLRKKT